MLVWYGPGEWIDMKFPGVPVLNEDHDNYPDIIQLASGDGYKLTGEDNGLVMTPKGTSGSTANAYNAGNELSAAWYQPFTNEYYSGLRRLNGAEAGTTARPMYDATTVVTWGIVPTKDSDGYNPLVACGDAAGVSLLAANATLLVASVSSAILLSLLN